MLHGCLFFEAYHSHQVIGYVDLSPRKIPSILTFRSSLPALTKGNPPFCQASPIPKV
jgi:hypothetical protein